MNTKVGIQEIIDSFISKSELDKDKAEEFANLFFTVIEEGLAKDRYVKIKGFGAFKLVDVENRESINVNTGERFEIQGHTKVSFTPEPVLRDLINKPFAHFQTVIVSDNVSFEGEEKDAEDTTTNAEEPEAIPEVLKEEQPPVAIKPEEQPVGIAAEEETTHEQIKPETISEPVIPEPEPVAEPEPITKPEPQVAPEPLKQPVSAPKIAAESVAKTKQVIVEPLMQDETMRPKSKSGIYVGIIIVVILLCVVMFVIFSSFTILPDSSLLGKTGLAELFERMNI